MDAELLEPARWTIAPLQGVAGCWPPCTVGRDCFRRVTFTVMVPAVCTVTLAVVPPNPTVWRRFPPWRFRRTAAGWAPRRRLRLIDEDHLVDASLQPDRPAERQGDDSMLLSILAVLTAIVAAIAILRAQRHASRRSPTATGGPRPVWPRAGDATPHRHQHAHLFARPDHRRAAGGLGARSLASARPVT